MAAPQQEVECIEIVPGKIFHLKNVLSHEKCAELRDWADEFGWSAPIRVPYQLEELAEFSFSLRTSLRIEKIKDQAFSDMLTQRVNPHLPQELEDGRTIRPVFETFRFDKYAESGGHFRPHYDDSKFRIEGEKRGEASVFTLMIWLNEEYEGGETHFLPCKLQGEDIYIKGNTGDALIFWQNGMLHEGTDTISGTKYIVHSNIMYSPHVGMGKRPVPQRFRFAKHIRQEQQALQKRQFEEHGSYYATVDADPEGGFIQQIEERQRIAYMEDKNFPVTVEA